MKNIIFPIIDLILTIKGFYPKNPAKSATARVNSGFQPDCSFFEQQKF